MKLKNGFYQRKGMTEEGVKSPFLLDENGNRLTFYIYCSTCGNGLCLNLSIGKNKIGDHIVLVDPCPECMSALAKGVEPKPPMSSLDYRLNGLELDNAVGS